jgi:nucleotide-binding universal stress UspA family protein
MSEHPVVACYRGPDSADGVQLGAVLAHALGEPLVLAAAYRYEPVALSARVLPAADNERRAIAAQRALRRARQFAGAGVEVREEIVPAARIVDALVQLTRDVDACVLVAGRDTAGSVTRSLISRSPCLVAVAPLSVPLPQTGPWRRIGVAYDGSPAARWALVAATQLAQAVDAQLVLLAADRTSQHAAAWLHTARLGVEGKVEHTSRPLVGPAAPALEEASGDLDLLVCGSRGHGRALGAILGSVSAHLIAHAHCPVLVVPPVVWASTPGPPGINSTTNA